VLDWIARRCDGEAEATETAIGLVPAPGAINTEGLELAPEDLERILAVDADDVRRQLPQVEEHLARFGDRLPEALREQLEALRRRLEG
jgi:phosphoenolpyruvate carboxykinase (GTP)